MATGTDAQQRPATPATAIATTTHTVTNVHGGRDRGGKQVSNYFKPIVEEKISGEESNLFRYRSCGDLLRIPPHMRIDTKTFVKYLSDPECHLNKFNLEPKIGGRKRNVLIGNYKIQTNAGYGWCARKKYRQEMEPSVHGPTLAISRKKRHVT